MGYDNDNGVDDDKRKAKSKNTCTTQSTSPTDKHEALKRLNNKNGIGLLVTDKAVVLLQLKRDLTLLLKRSVHNKLLTPNKSDALEIHYYRKRCRVPQPLKHNGLHKVH